MQKAIIQKSNQSSVEIRINENTMSREFINVGLNKDCYLRLRGRRSAQSRISREARRRHYAF